MVPATPDQSAPWGPERAHLRLDTDPWDRPHLPGTSVAGALRDMVRAAGETGESDDLFGCLLDPEPGGTEVAARASRVWVLGSRLLEAPGTELRASTAIHRGRGAAERNTLRAEELLPAGSSFEVFLRWDNAAGAELDRFLRLLVAWSPLIGRGSSRGRGRCQAGNVRHGTLRLDDPAGLLMWLTLSGPELVGAVATAGVALASESAGVTPVLDVTLRITGPLLVGSGKPGEGSDQVARMFRAGDRYLVPGTGLKGLLRSRAEYILRSVGVTPPPCLDQQCGRCWTCQVFGYSGGPDAGSDSVGRRALIRVTDAVIADAVVRERKHVAIDRFTGGAADKLLYTMEGLEQGSFRLRVEPLDPGLQAPELAEVRSVLRLVLQDLDDGIIGVGAAVTRGYGSVSVDLAEAERRGELPGLDAARAGLARLVEETPS